MTRNLIFILACIIIVSCKNIEARRPVQSSSSSFISESVERNKVIYEQQKELITKILDANPEQAYFTSENGFWYYYNKKDSLPLQKPRYGDYVTFSYNVKNLNGTSILSENEIGLQKDYIIDKTNQELISGIRDGIKLMKEGETVTFLFPSYKAYGYYGITNKLGANIPVQCTITLNKIKQKNENY